MSSNRVFPVKIAALIPFLLCTGFVFSQTAVLPHYTYKDGLWETEISLYVPGARDRLMTVTAYDNEGNLDAVADIRIPSLTGFLGTVDELMGTLSGEVGWLEFSGEEVDLQGIMKFTYVPTGASSSLPLTVDTGQRAAMLLLENSDTWRGGFAMTNVSHQRADLVLSLKAHDGTLLNTSVASLAPKAKLVAMLEDVFPEPLPEAAILEVESTSDIAAFALTFESQMQQIVAVPAVQLPPIPVSEEDVLLNETFRIDIQTIDVDFDFLPNQGLLEADARVVFRMRPEQSKALVHLDDTIISSYLDEVWLNGQSVDPADAGQVKLVSFANTSQRGFEFQQVLAPHVDHVLDMRYAVPVGYSAPSLYTDCNDIVGRGNEVFFPTINSPAELARHRLRFRVNDIPYVFIGSGNVIEEDAAQGQSWFLDTEEEVASYTVMWVMMPNNVAELETRVIDDVDVRIMSFIGGASRNPAFDALETWMPELRQNLGPFPMSRGISIFLTGGGGGMEYYGGTITSLWALEHEVFHMYFGCSVVAKTYRDSWWDEAINIWYEESAVPGMLNPISSTYQSNIVSGRTPITPGFDTRAYDDGAQIIQAVADEMGGRQEMIDFLAYLVANYTFRPFTTLDFLDYLEDFSGLDMRPEFQQWLYQGEDIGKSESRPVSYHAPVDMTPPIAVQQGMD